MAKIKIDIDRRNGEIDPKIYGNFIEHLGRCIYGGIYDEDSSKSNENNIRQDVLEAARALNITHLRWPGGNFVSGYHWEDGIGPVKNRPKKIELAWGAVESNRFGTDEYISFCDALGAEPHICVNMGNGTMEEAQNWVEYCNGQRDSKYANLRRKYNQEEPYNVKYWGLGNEIYGEWQIGHKNVYDYVREAREYAKVMKRVDPTINLVACGAGTPEWDRVVVEELGDIVEYISTHMYVGNEQDNYYKYMATTKQIESRLNMLEGIINSVMHESSESNRLKIAFDEWNVWYRTLPSAEEDLDFDSHALLEEHYNLEDALVVSMFLNSFIRHCKFVKIANFAQLVNVIAPMMVKENDLFQQTIYYPLYLFANHNGAISLDCYVDCDGYEENKVAIPYLDVSASYSEKNNVITLNVINRHKDEHVTAEIESQQGNFRESIDIYEVNGEDVKVSNSFENKEEVKIENNTISGVKTPFVYEFSPHSLTVLKLGLKARI